MSDRRERVAAPHDDPATELAHCRTAIENIDRELLDLLGERLALGRRTAELKRSMGRSVLDPGREAEVVRRAATLARERGLPDEAVREIFWRIVGMVRGAELDRDAE